MTKVGIGSQGINESALLRDNDLEEAKRLGVADDRDCHEVSENNLTCDCCW